MNGSRIFAASLVAIVTCVLAFSSADCMAVLGHAWHIPRSAEPTGVPSMRNPREPLTAGAVTFYSGNYQPDGNQSAGFLIYKKSTSVSYNDSVVLTLRHDQWQQQLLARNNSSVDPQYLKLFDVTPPPSAGTPMGGTPAGPNFYVVTNSVTFSRLPANDPEDDVSGYRIMGGTSCSDSSITNVTVGNLTSFTVTGSFGQTLFARVAAINGVGVEGATNCTAVGVTLLDPTTDRDGDGMNNCSEDMAGTNPFDQSSLFHVIRVRRLLSGDAELTWDSVVGKKYVVQSTDSMTAPFADLSGTNTASGVASVFTNSTGVAGRFYRVKLVS